MGGDLGPRAAFPACEMALQKNTSLVLVLFASAQALAEIPLALKNHSRVELHSCASVLASDSDPISVLRAKDSSLWLAVAALASGEVDACVSGGNTGAMMVCGKRQLGMVADLQRPAICQQLPTRKGATYMLDLGANLGSSAEMLVQFACMGAALFTASKPRVALLNIGTEANKGGELLAHTAELLQQVTELDYVGFIEADHILDGDVELVVTDGFAGNVALKASEGAARFLVAKLRAAFEQSWYGRLIGQLAKPVLLKWRTQFDPARYNGASFLGLQKPLIKSHGGADASAFYHAIAVAIGQVEQQLPQLIAARLSRRASDSA